MKAFPATLLATYAVAQTVPPSCVVLKAAWDAAIAAKTDTTGVKIAYDSCVTSNNASCAAAYATLNTAIIGGVQSSIDSASANLNALGCNGDGSVAGDGA